MATAKSVNMEANSSNQRRRSRSPWASSKLAISTTVLALGLAALILQSFMTKQREQKGCNMCWMRPAWAHFADFDTEHTRLGRKYRLFLYREGGVDEDTRVKGTPVIFIPGNAGSYGQGRPHGAWAATYYQDILQRNRDASNTTKLPFDVFALDFNEDITAFHGQTLQDQAEYLNEAIAYVLGLYHNPHRSLRDHNLPYPTSVILIAHSMGGVVARTTMTLPNHPPNSVNTIITLAAPHSKAPISLDGDVVQIYDKTNKYWREAFSHGWQDSNPLRHVTIISIAGGSLDTMVPSDYSTMASLVPLTNGFTVFTSTIPNVWVSMDHLAITWCDQLRKAIVEALYDVADASRLTQTRSTEERMRIFKKWFLTGMENISERESTRTEYNTLLTIEENSENTISSSDRLILSQLGKSDKPNAYILPISTDLSDDTRFNLLSNQELDSTNRPTVVEVFLCSDLHDKEKYSAESLPIHITVSHDASHSKRLVCTTASPDVIILPPSTEETVYPFNNPEHFSYLRYDMKDLANHQFIAIIDKSESPRPGWLISEFGPRQPELFDHAHYGLSNLVFSSINVETRNALVAELRIPFIDSSLLAYTLIAEQENCPAGSALFKPLMRQYISDPYESRYHVNVQSTNLSLHGVSPFVPPQSRGRDNDEGLTLQVWSDPSCGTSMKISIKLDILGSLGKLWMRYRTVFAAFPLVIVSLVLLKQFWLHDQTTVFVTFSDSMDACLRQSIPITFSVLTILGVILSFISRSNSQLIVSEKFDAKVQEIEKTINFNENDLLLGLRDPFFWYLVPLFGLISIGVCMVVNYAILATVYFITSVTSAISSTFNRNGNNRVANGRGPFQRRIIVTGVLISLVFTIVPYQAVFALLCLMQVSTCVQALMALRESQSPGDANFFNYTQSILLLLIWILPINLPVLIVWIRNLRVHFLAPFSHHNVLSIIPLLLLVQIVSSGRMIPQKRGPIKLVNSGLFILVAFYAAVYGVSYAYLLHDVVNLACGWLVVLYVLNGADWRLPTFNGTLQLFEGTISQRVHVVKEKH